MERRKHKATRDELAFVKAAAWAWYQHGYQHGSGSEGKAVHEFNLTETQRAPRPPRYKLEAMRMEGYSSQSSLIPSHTDNSLLDPYEVGRISKHLEYLIESTRDHYHGESHVCGEDHRKDGSLSESRKKKKEKKSKILNGFLLRHAETCGSRGDVVEGRVLAGPRWPNHGLVFGLSTCRPRTNDA